MSTETSVNRCVFDLKDLVTVAVTNNLFEARNSGNLNLDDESVKLVITLVNQSVADAVNKTSLRISKALAGKTV